MTPRKRDKGGKFVTHVPGPESINIISRELVDPILELAEKDVSPTAADLDRHQANVEAENQSRMDTERKQMYPKRVGGVSPGDTVPTFPVPGNYPIEVDEDSIPPQPSVPYGGIALFSASLAILAILGTLWAVYYVIRPKLDNLVQSSGYRMAMHDDICVDDHNRLKVCGPDPAGISHIEDLPVTRDDPKSEHPGIGGVGGAEYVPNSQFLITAKEDVWLKFSMDGKSVMPGRQFVKGEQIGWNLTDNDILEIRAGKPDSLVIYFSNREIHPENKYHGGGNLAEYVLDGKELLAGK